KIHQRFGKLKWEELFQPAIYFAEQGFPVTEIIHDHWRASYSKLIADQNGKKIFLHDGSAPEVGEVFRNPQLAAAMKLIAWGGPAAFYRGPIAKALVRTSDRLGGLMAAADLSEFDSEWVSPVSTDYRGWKVYELPPNSQGVAALQMLNIMGHFPLFNFSPRSVDVLHIQMEAQKLAYADLERYLGDPRFGKIPVSGLLSKEYSRTTA